MRIDPEYVEDPALLRSEILRLHAVIAASEPTLTDAEREAVEEAIRAFGEFAGDEIYVTALRGLLERCAIGSE